MYMKNLGIIGWRGMVGSVLLQRMAEENDFANFRTHFFSTSQAGKDAPTKLNAEAKLLDAYDIDSLLSMDIIITAQGSDYTQKIHGQLRNSGWAGFWIDAASSLRYEESSTLILDPVNRDVIDSALAEGKKDFIGANCTVSTMLMGIAGLFRQDLVEWISSATYQAASGAGSANMQEMLMQMNAIGQASMPIVEDTSKTILDLDRQIGELIKSDSLPTDNFRAPLAGNVLPWIDSEMDSGQSREEWKGMVETNKIVGTDQLIPIDGTCVRVSAMRSHSQALTIKLKNNIPISEIEQIIASSTDWTESISNNKHDSISKLTPAEVSGSLNVRVGRIRKMTLGEEYLNAFVVGDQLLWGAAEPLRRMANILK